MVAPNSKSLENRVFTPKLDERSPRTPQCSVKPQNRSKKEEEGNNKRKTPEYLPSNFIGLHELYRLPDDSIKAPVHQVSVAESTLDVNESQTLDNEETPNFGEGWTVFESKGANA